MKEQLKGFKDYADYLSYAEICLDYSTEGNKLLHNYLLSNQDHIDPVQKIRQMNAITSVRYCGEDQYRRLHGERSLCVVKSAMTEPTLVLISKLENA